MEPLTHRSGIFAANAHLNTFRRDEETPYISHPLAVARTVQEAGYSEYHVAVAHLHDVLEDTSKTVTDLREASFPSEVIEAVELLTRKVGDDYDDYLRGVAANRLARPVKIADMLHNLCDNPTRKQKEKYTRGIMFLAEYRP